MSAGGIRVPAVAASTANKRLQQEVALEFARRRAYVFLQRGVRNAPEFSRDNRRHRDEDPLFLRPLVHPPDHPLGVLVPLLDVAETIGGIFALIDGISQ